MQMLMLNLLMQAVMINRRIMQKQRLLYLNLTWKAVLKDAITMKNRQHRKEENIPIQ